MISFQDVSVNYALGKTALDSASFDIEDGEFVYLVGPSGAGKTTILRLMLRDLVASKGTINIDGQDISDRKFKYVSQLRQNIGVVFQDFKILSNANIFENIAVSLRIKGYSDAKIKNEVENSLALTGITDKKLQFPSQISAGELQRVAIARAVVGNRKIILADEPTGNLDPKTTWEIMKIFKKLEQNHIILFATHNTDIVNSLKRRVIVLKNGKVVKDKKKGGYEL